MKWVNSNITLLLMFFCSFSLVALGNSEVIRVLELIASGYIGYLQREDRHC